MSYFNVICVIRHNMTFKNDICVNCDLSIGLSVDLSIGESVGLSNSSSFGWCNDLCVGVMICVLE